MWHKTPRRHQKPLPDHRDDHLRRTPRRQDRRGRRRAQTGPRPIPVWETAPPIPPFPPTSWSAIPRPIETSARSSPWSKGESTPRAAGRSPFQPGRPSSTAVAWDRTRGQARDSWTISVRSKSTRNASELGALLAPRVLEALGAPAEAYRQGGHRRGLAADRARFRLIHTLDVRRPTSARRRSATTTKLPDGGREARPRGNRLRHPDEAHHGRPRSASTTRRSRCASPTPRTPHEARCRRTGRPARAGPPAAAARGEGLVEPSSSEQGAHHGRSHVS